MKSHEIRMEPAQFDGMWRGDKTFVMVTLGGAESWDVGDELIVVEADPNTQKDMGRRLYGKISWRAAATETMGVLAFRETHRKKGQGFV